MLRSQCVIIGCVMAVVFGSFGFLSGAELIVLRKGDSGKIIGVKNETVIQIELEEKGSAGYQWSFDENDIKKFEIIDTELKDKATQGMVGASILKTWKLKAKVKGQSRLKMYYYRPWEGRDTAVEHFEVTVNLS